MQLLSCNPIYLPHSFQVLTDLSQGREAMPYMDSKEPEFFLREKTFTFIIYACGATAQKPERSALIQIPGFSSSLIITYCQRYMK